MRKLLLGLVAILATSASASDSGFLWRITPPANSKWNLVQTVRSRTQHVVTLNGDSPTPGGKIVSDAVRTMRYELDLDVLDRDSRGFFTLKARIINVSSSVTNRATNRPANEFLETRLDDHINNALSVFRMKELTLRVSPTGRILSLAGTEEIKSDLRDLGMPILNSVPAVKVATEKLLTADGLQSLLFHTKELPPRPLKIGEIQSYRESASGSGGMSGSGNARRKLLNFDGDVASFEETGSVHAKFQGKTFGNFIADFNAEGQGAGYEKYSVTANTGLVQESRGSMSFQGMLHLASPPRGNDPLVPVTTTGYFVTTIQPRIDNPNIIYLP